MVDMLASWPSVAFSDARTLPRISAVYACGDRDGRVLYIGSSVNIRARWSKHDYKDVLYTMECCWIAWQPCPMHKMQEQERQLIAALQPLINTRPANRPAIVPRLTCICQQCGASFERIPSEVRKNKEHWNTFCSIACRKASKGERIACICVQCQQPFTVKPSVKEGGGGKYCSQACYTASRGGRISSICQRCGEPFRVKPSTAKVAEPLYCSRRCYEAHLGHGQVICTCQHCQKVFSRYIHVVRASGGKTFCSHRCYVLHRGTALERFWAFVQRCEHEEYCLYCCWLWKGQLDNKDYGRLFVDGKNRAAHRFSWELHNARPLPVNTNRFVVQHLCHTPRCVNPWHLQFGTQSQNIKDAIRVGRFWQYGDHNPSNRPVTQA